MPTVISGTDLGLANVHSQGTQGQGIQGQGGVGLYVNTTTGNLVLQQQDQVLVGQGIDTGLIRTYNSLGQFTDDNGDNFRFAFNQRLVNLTGTANTAGTRITRIAGDGSESEFLYDQARGLYITDEGTGAHDTIAYDGITGEWTYTEGTSQQQDVYYGTGTGQNERHLIRQLDTDGNTTTFGYHTNGFIDTITDASGQVMAISYSGDNATEVSTTSNGLTQTLVRYSYDTQNRLTQVSIDLSPEDNSVADNHTYLTQYAYEGDSKRIARVSQSDGTTTAFTYDTQGRVVTVTDGENNTVTYSYSDAAPETHTTTTQYPLNSDALTPPTAAAPEIYYSVPANATVLNQNTLDLSQMSKLELDSDYFEIEDYSHLNQVASM